MSSSSLNTAAVLFLSFSCKTVAYRLRLVCHAAKDAIDKTVTTVRIPFGSEYSDNDWIGSLANSNWKEVKEIYYLFGIESSGIKLLAEGGFSKLESLTLRFHPPMDTNISSAESVIQAGWKLKTLAASGMSPEWLAAVKAANWPLEELILPNSRDAITDIIGNSDWPLKSLDLSGSTISAEGMRRLMQGSWVSTIECLDLNCADIKEEGFRAIAEASHRAPNLARLSLTRCDITDKEALILAQGSYPKLRTLHIDANNITSHILISLLKKCPVLKGFQPTCVFSRSNPLDDPADAKFIAQQCKGDGELDLEGLWMTKRGADSFFAAINGPTLESLTISNPSPFLGEEQCVNIAIAAIVELDWPCLKELDITDITSEGNRLLSRKKFPALERLKVEVEDSGLELDTAMLPSLKSLTLQGNVHVKDAVEFISTQEWPHLESLGLHTPSYDDNDEDDASTWALRMLHRLNTTRMPSLKMLSLTENAYTEREMHTIAWALRNSGRDIYLLWV